MDFSQVRYFLALAETLNFTRAAEQCHVTQPTLTQSIKRLEEELGGPLIYREGRYSRLTKLGHALRAHFEKIEETRLALKDSARAVTAGEMEELNIGLMCTIGPKMLTRFLDEFQMEHPNAHLLFHDIGSNSVDELLLSGAIDGAFAARHKDKHPRLGYTTLYSEAMVVAFPEGHEFSKLEAVPLATIACQRYIDRLHCEFRSAFVTFTEERQIDLDIAFTSEREDWIQDMIKDGLGVSVMPEFSLIAPMLENRPVTDPILNRHVEFVTVHGGAKGSALRALIQKAANFRWVRAGESEPNTEGGQ